ncbi:hypothetical protein PsorP6_002322 [Peronosclerospora sorghi]|uniref:Uncharacterized protein n=1 Tax=Peronosclerospora sorghi TaxID=230839 RepID=A0ACC0WUA9_9STRA|nr:hypothetical protein PsorP6_002322 [Peronosclerospora sorghi]
MRSRRFIPPSTLERRCGKTEGLRRHGKPSNEGRDPRRRGASASHQPHHRGDSSNAAGSSDLYERLPAPVRAVVDIMRIEGRLHEPLSDNVVMRLLDLPERVALQDVENFSKVDLSQVENLQGFLDGIINRVNEKAIASKKQHRLQLPSLRRCGDVIRNVLLYYAVIDYVRREQGFVNGINGNEREKSIHQEESQDGVVRDATPRFYKVHATVDLHYPWIRRPTNKVFEANQTLNHSLKHLLNLSLSQSTSPRYFETQGKLQLLLP